MGGDTLSKKAFREFLNHGNYQHSHANNRYGNRKRPYGDYLYSQDREKFNVDYEEWKTAKQTEEAKQ
jgi:NADH:ubiquinone oxidoreductase subunit